MRLAWIFAAVTALALGGAAQGQVSAPAQRVLDRARQAQGGAAAWNAVRGLHETGQAGEGRYERWVDPLRYGLRTETEESGAKRVQGYNGFGEWRILADGQSTGSAELDIIAEVRSDAFFAAYGYFFAGRFDHRAVHVGTRQAQGRSFDVVRIEPVGGEPRELWFDRRTGLLAIVADDTGPSRGRTEYSDYRRAGAVTLAHKAVVYGGEGSTSRELAATTIALTPVDRALFSLPRKDGE